MVKQLKSVSPTVAYDQASGGASGSGHPSNRDEGAESNLLPLESGRALAVTYLESALGVGTRPTDVEDERDSVAGSERSLPVAEAPGECDGQVLGHLFSVGLVFWVDTVSFSGGGCIKDHCEMSGLLMSDEFYQGRSKSKNGGGIETFRGENRTTNEREVGTIRESHTVEEIETFLHLVRL